MVHAKVLQRPQPLVDAGQRHGVAEAVARFLPVMGGRVRVHDTGTRVEHHHHGKRLVGLGEFHRSADDRLMAAVHAVEHADRDHGFPVGTQRRPFDQPGGVRGKSRDFHG